MKKFVLASAVALAAACAVYAQAPATEQPTAPAIKVEKILAATGVENRVPVGEAVTFGKAVERVYVWTRITAERTPVKIKHVYYFEGKKAGEIELMVNSSPYRVWSNKSVRPGSWKVEVTDEAGAVLASLEFTVTAEAAAQPAK